MTPQYPACYMLIRKDDKYLFVMRENTGYMDGMYSLPAGRVEENETFIDGAIREAGEEVGVVINKANTRLCMTSHRYAKTSQFPYWVDLYFEASSWKEEPYNKASNEHSGIAWLPMNKLPENIMPYQKYALEQLAQGKNYCEFGWKEN